MAFYKNKIIRANFTYVDLFAGIGGFRIALEQYTNKKARCLYASEINRESAKIYELNFKQKPLGDIKKINPSDLECPEVVCGGFPCQTFSKGGKQSGFKDSRGTLFREIIRIISFYPKKKRPKILILENVQNLISHDKGNTWKTIHHEVKEIGYNIIDKPIVISPNDVGVPQLRSRAIILAVREDLYSNPIRISVKRKKHNLYKLEDILDRFRVNKKYYLTKKEIEILKCWNEFIHIIPKSKRIIGFPIWSDEFGKTYDLSKYKEWKKQIIQKNRNLYSTYKTKIDAWRKKWNIKSFTPTNRKFEWQAGLSENNIFNCIIQFRTSGVRVKCPTESPALVAMNHTPVYGPLRRYITPREAARLQSFPESYRFKETDNEAYKQLGNAVNVKVIKYIFDLFIKSITKKDRS